MESHDRERVVVAGGALALVLGAFFAGRYSNPTRVEERVRVETVEKQVVVVQEKVRVETVTVEKVVVQTKVVTHEVSHPDGTREVTRTEEAQATSASKHEAVAVEEKRGSAITSTESLREEARVVADLPRWRLGATVGLGLGDLARPIYGGEVGLRVVGPFWVGVSVRSDLTASLGLAVEW